MTLKSWGKKTWVLAACAGLCDCQQTQPRTPSPAFAQQQQQRPLTQQQFAGQPTMQQGMGQQGMGAPTSTTMQSFPQSGMPAGAMPTSGMQSGGMPSSGLSQTGGAPSSMNTVPTQSPAFGSQSRVTQTYTPPTSSATSFGSQPGVPTLTPTTGAPTFDNMPPPMPPPPSPGFGARQ